MMGATTIAETSSVAVIPPLARPQTAAIAFDAGRVTKGNLRSTEGLSSASSSKSGDAFRQFESFVLQSFIETMLPKNAESVFGKGTAGAIWKSMLAEKLADQISRSGGIGIAQRIAASKGAQVVPTSIEASRQPATGTMEPTVPPLSIPEHGDDV
jgi:Rod binding protein